MKGMFFMKKFMVKGNIWSLLYLSYTLQDSGNLAVVLVLLIFYSAAILWHYHFSKFLCSYLWSLRAHRNRDIIIDRNVASIALGSKSLLLIVLLPIAVNSATAGFFFSFFLLLAITLGQNWSCAWHVVLHDCKRCLFLVKCSWFDTRIPIVGFSWRDQGKIWESSC